MTDRSAESASPPPDPLRDPMAAVRLAFGLLGAPGAWLVQLQVAAATGSLACLDAAGAALTRSAEPAWIALLAVNLVAAAVAALATAVAWGDLRRARRAARARPGTRGAARTRFLATSGTVLGALFLAATLASTVSIAMRGACPA